MSVVVEHDKRRQEILQNALEVFIDEGYEDVTFQKIADRCGITRTTLYIYFKNKREIFAWSIKQLTAEIESRLKKIVAEENSSAEITLRKTLGAMVDECEKHRGLFSVVLFYLLNCRKNGIDPGERVRRRLIRMRHLIDGILIRGMKDGEFKKMNVRTTYEMLYSLILSSVFRFSVLGENSIGAIRETLDLAVDGLIRERVICE